MSTRRELLTAEPLRNALVPSESDSARQAAQFPRGRATVRLGKTAMACDFEVLFNPGHPEPAKQIDAASQALVLIDRLENQMSVYRAHSELSQINACAVEGPVPVEPRLFELLERAMRFARETGGAFDPTSGPLVALWRRCRKERRVPTDDEVAAARALVGFDLVELDAKTTSVRFVKPGVELNLNAIGKGYALDRAAEILDAIDAGRRVSDQGESAIESGEPGASAPGFPRSLSAVEAPPGAEQATSNALFTNPGADAPGSPNQICAPDSPGAWLIHGGFSSILARGSITGGQGWPIGIRHPLFPKKQLATLQLRDRGMSTSGSGVQFFRHRGRRYGHLLDARTGWPVEGILSVTVLAPTAAQAEALSTAFFVLGVEKAREYCHNHPEVAALLIPAPPRGRRLEPVNCGIPESSLSFTPEA